MLRYYRTAVLLALTLMGVLRSADGDDVETLTEKQLESLVAQTDFVLTLYCMYFRRFILFSLYIAVSISRV